jgi:hypothetical protein
MAEKYANEEATDEELRCAYTTTYATRNTATYAANAAATYDARDAARNAATYAASAAAAYDDTRDAQVNQLKTYFN